MLRFPVWLPCAITLSLSKLKKEEFLFEQGLTYLWTRTYIPWKVAILSYFAGRIFVRHRSFSTCAKIFWKTDIFHPLIRTRTSAYHEVRNNSFSASFVYVLNEWSINWNQTKNESLNENSNVSIVFSCLRKKKLWYSYHKSLWRLPWKQQWRVGCP